MRRCISMQVLLVGFNPNTMIQQMRPWMAWLAEWFCYTIINIQQCQIAASWSWRIIEAGVKNQILHCAAISSSLISNVNNRQINLSQFFSATYYMSSNINKCIGKQAFLREQKISFTMYKQWEQTINIQHTKCFIPLTVRFYVARVAAAGKTRR